MVNTKTDFRIILLVSLCLIVVIIVPYWQVINFDFVGYDDELYVTKNFTVQKGFTANAYNEIGVILFQQGKYKKAGIFFSKAVRIRPNYTEALKNITILEKILSSQ